MIRWMLALLTIACGCSHAPKQESVRAEAAAKAAPAQAKDQVVISLEAQRQAGITVGEITGRPVPRTLRAAGRITQDENRTWRVGAVAEGRVERVLANVGDRVEAGAVLARIHSHDIHESRAEFQKAKADLNRAKTAEEYARRTRDRTVRLLELKAASVEQKEHAEAAWRFAETAVANAEVELNRTRLHLEEFLGIPAEDPHPQGGAHGDDEDLIPVRAPAPGVVVTRSISRGAVVSQSNDLFLISDLSSVWMIAEVNSESLPSLRVGMPVRLFVAAYPERPFPGRIGKLGEALDPQTRTVHVRVEVSNPRGLLKPEMYATAEINVGESAPALLVPQEAIQEVRGANSVFVRQAPDRFVIRPVELGRNLDGSSEVVRGLSAGEFIATKGSFILKSEFLKASLTEEE